MNSTHSANLNSDTLLHVAKLLISDPDPKSEQTLKTLCDIRPDLGYRVRQLDGGDYSDLRAQIKNQLYNPLLENNETQFNKPSVAKALTAKFISGLSKGKYRYRIIQHIKSHGFNLRSGPINDMIKNLPMSEQRKVLSEIKQSIKADLIAGNKELTQLMIQHPELMNQYRTADELDLATTAFHSLLVLMHQACNPQSNQTASTQLLKKTLHSNPQHFFQITPFQRAVTLLN